MSKKSPLLLMILDGWGYKEDPQHNAIAQAKTPVLDQLNLDYPNTLIHGSGLEVGLPDGQMGNSEVGHVNLGAGRIVYQDFTRITKAVRDNSFADNSVLTYAIDQAVSNNKAVHLMGLLSPGGVHSHEEHIVAMIELAHQRGAKAIYLHAFLDGRDTPPRSAANSIALIEQTFARLQTGAIASIIGRYYAMDRDQRWDRVQAAYELMTQGKAQFSYTSAIQALEAAYQRDESDEFVKASLITGSDSKIDKTINAGDTLFFINFRADRARQMSRAFVDNDFAGFSRAKSLQLGAFVTLTRYADDIDAPCAFPPTPLENVLGEWLQKNHKTQLRISETEKYAHVTFFFSGGKESEFDGEERILVPSPDVATYDLQPAMNSTLLTDKLIEAINSEKYDVIICNYPNGDMVGHTGVFSAAVEACEAVDACVGRVIEALKAVGGECLITADHGNAEQMQDLTSGQAHTAHTSEPVPFIYVGRPVSNIGYGALSDVAPTMLYLMGIEQPSQMTGQSILTLAQ
ncbi:MAG: 2,3-bisphosphoglycerate-independent phosphoglycerate mutase [Alteromonadaceae bacterium]|jgi:2,3-bisphosphoglycerate-independent phosphoglycerate mutase